jgi:predicted metal-dependent phosphotriesterase family hydrolase
MTLFPRAELGDDEGSIVTVEGPIDPESVGPVLPHEHLFGDFTDKLDRPSTAVGRQTARAPITLENLTWIRDNLVSHEETLRLDSLADAVEELGHFYRAGGDVIVDVTPKNVGGDPQRVRGVARETGVQAVHGTAFYVHYSHPARVDDMDVDEIADEFVSDVLTGIDDTGLEPESSVKSARPSVFSLLRKNASVVALARHGGRVPHSRSTHRFIATKRIQPRSGRCGASTLPRRRVFHQTRLSSVTVTSRSGVSQT